MSHIDKLLDHLCASRLYFTLNYVLADWQKWFSPFNMLPFQVYWVAAKFQSTACYKPNVSMQHDRDSPQVLEKRQVSYRGWYLSFQCVMGRDVTKQTVCLCGHELGRTWAANTLQKSFTLLSDYASREWGQNKNPGPAGFSQWYSNSEINAI